jgi:hypothetical protein
VTETTTITTMTMIDIMIETETTMIMIDTMATTMITTETNRK